MVEKGIFGPDGPKMFGQTDEVSRQFVDKISQFIGEISWTDNTAQTNEKD